MTKQCALRGLVPTWATQNELQYGLGGNLLAPGSPGELLAPFYRYVPGGEIGASYPQLNWPYMKRGRMQ